MKQEEQIALGVLLVGGALWFVMRSKPAPIATPPPPAPPTGPKKDPLAEFLGVPQLCFDMTKANYQMGIMCAGIDGAWKAAKKAGKWVGNQFKKCWNEGYDDDSLIKSEASNRSLNGPCRAMTTEPSWIHCPNTRPSSIFQVSPSAPDTKTRAGICVSYTNGCAPLTFAPARTRCKQGTRIYGYGTQTPENAAAAVKKWEDCARRHGNRRAEQYCGRPPEKALSGMAQPVAKSRFPAPYGGWLWGSLTSDHRST